MDLKRVIVFAKYNQLIRINAIVTNKICGFILLIEKRQKLDMRKRSETEVIRNLNQKFIKFVF